MNKKADVVIVGTGVAGLFSALNLPDDKEIIMITKSDAESSDSFLAQGGICVLRDEQDYERNEVVRFQRESRCSIRFSIRRHQSLCRPDKKI